jgi:peptidoglycan/LPS O-acetylase OafA/YrhL
VQYVPALDGLRAVAVMLVFLFHRSYAHFPGGWVGVDIFFVLSGFLITSILVNEHEATGAISLRRFYIRRAKRLLPALVVVVCVGVAAAVWFQNETLDTLIDAAAALLYVVDYRYAFMPVDGTGLVHLWSLSVEEQFYFVWPLLLIALLRRNRRTALCATLLLIMIVAVWRAFLSASSVGSFSRIYFAFDTRADELLIGCALALWQPRLPASGFLKHLWPVVILFFAAVVLTAPKLGGPLQQYIDIVGYPLIGATVAYLIVIVTSGESNVLTFLLCLTPVVALGRISYGFYLWHVLIIHQPIIEDRLTYRSISTFALTLAASVLSYCLIERPLLRRKSTRDVGSSIAPFFIRNLMAPLQTTSSQPGLSRLKSVSLRQPPDDKG